MFKALHATNSLVSRIKEFEIDWYGEKPIQNVNVVIKGLRLVEDFITKETQQALIDQIDQGVWLSELKRRVQHYGYKYDYRARAINESMKVAPLPDWVNPIIEKMLVGGVFPTAPDQMIINEYQPGQGIAAHVDCVPCFGEQIISLSLGSTAVMEFKGLKTNQKITKLLTPGSLLVMEGDARYNWQHGIPPRKSDLINGKRKQRSRRLSLTFRKVILG
ncbi:MAG: alpha-ketoglutarate-dependent dioxygenase AlkB [Bacteroidetes bacterium]|nr:MAG: alpha-ketoglutarate-dependent dioxygenase AlkB [Bacteroidota bacterium]